MTPRFRLAGSLAELPPSFPSKVWSGRAGDLAPFAGRRKELRHLADCAAEAASGHPRSVHIVGETGIGKTALARRFLCGLSAPQVLWASCDPSERYYPYAMVDQLKAGLDCGKSRSPLAPQHVTRQLLMALRSRPEAGTAVLVIDDMQWADEGSMGCIDLLMRQLTTESVLVLFIERREAFVSRPVLYQNLTPAAWQVRTSEIALRELAEPEVAHFLNEIAPAVDLTHLTRPLYEYAGGHPFYTQAVARAVTKEPQASLGVTPEISQAVRRRLHELPLPAVQLVEALAILDGPQPLGVASHVARIEGSADALEEGLTAGLLSWWPEHEATLAAVRYPVLRDAIVATLQSARKRQLHAAAVPVADAAKVWGHKVACAQTVDPELADDLEKEATFCLAEGDIKRAAEYILWAADLSSERKDSERRLLSAAAHFLWIGDYVAVRRQIGRIRECSLSPLRKLVSAGLAASHGHPASAESDLAAIVGDPRLACEPPWVRTMARLWLAAACLAQGRSVQAAEVVGAMNQQRGIDGYLERRVTVLSALAYGRSEGAAAGLRVLETHSQLPQDPCDVMTEEKTLLVHRGFLRAWSGDVTAGLDDLTTAVRMSHPHESVVSSWQAHIYLAHAEYLHGSWNAACVEAERAASLSTEHGSEGWLSPEPSIGALIAAHRGQDEQAYHLLQRNGGGGAASIVFSYTVEAAIAHSKANYGEAVRLLQPLLDAPEGRDRLAEVYWLPLWIESLIQQGELEDARRALKRLESTAAGGTASVARAWLRGLLAQAEGDPEAAQSHFQDGASVPEGSGESLFHRALLEHAFGSCLLTLRERRDAAHWLRQAYARFKQLGAQPFVDRCAADLEACGLQGPRRAPEQLLSLTEREFGIAHLVAKGMTNREVADRVYLSQKTVEYHLSHIYAKLGISSRRHLRTLYRTWAQQ
ncbi:MULTISPECIES: LuxR family transcriptional regulator [Streptomyces]|uniref:helix-turn-helix transcriptional regulator n=1 Tax=Streptomyces TaxID=1883 RepID=UPI00099BE8E4|nr:LuxR family transcriptional regulator [Streptomyces virginiae]